eukprot:m.31992 g.31992  ORF g.31992 m.31992 type:complete len:942 (+) comp10743_c0_seq1:138-2963(+)
MEFFRPFKTWWSELNPATLSGAIDVIVIEQEDGSLLSTPFHVRFGKLTLFRPQERVVNIKVNGKSVPLDMKVGKLGECYFAQPLDADLPDCQTDAADDEDEDDEEAQRVQAELEALTQSAVHNGTFSADSKGRAKKLTKKRRSLPSMQNGDDVINVLHSAPPVDTTAGSSRWTWESTSGESPRGRHTTPPEPLLQHIHEPSPHVRGLSSIRASSSQRHLLASENDARRSDSVPPSKSPKEKKSASTSDSPRLHEGIGPHMSLRPSRLDPFAVSMGSRRVRSSNTVCSSNPSEIREIMVQDSGLTRVRTASPEMPLHIHGHIDGIGERHKKKPGSTTRLRKKRHNQSEIRDASSDSSSDVPDLHDHEHNSTEDGHRQVRTRSPSGMFMLDRDDDEDEELARNADSEAEEDGDEEQEHKDGAHEHENGKGPKASDTADDDAGAARRARRAARKAALNIHNHSNNKGSQSPTIGLERQVMKGSNKTTQHAKVARLQQEQESLSSLTSNLSLPDLLMGGSGSDGALSGASTPTPRDVSDKMNVALSLCGLSASIDEEEMARRFQDKQVTFEMLCKRPQLLDDSDLVVRIQDRYLAWKVAAPAILSQLVFHQPLPSETLDMLVDKHHPKQRSWFFWSRPATSDSRSRPTDAEDSETSAAESLDASRDSDALQQSLNGTPTPSYHRSVYLTSEQLLLLGLEQGVNECEFSVASKFQGRASITCHVYLWRHDAKLVVSDIDGTITRSDVLGHAAALVGTDWTQRGVASLFTTISRNGYHFVYLSSRSISQSLATKDYIVNINQDEHTLPEGPILLSPSSLFRSFHREVILRRPEEFKIACLSGVKRLFKGHENPLVAGFGNRHTDVVTYRAVGIPDSKIFIVDPQGLLRVSKGAYQSSYQQLADIVDQVFPVVDSSRSDEQHPEYNAFNFWRVPPPPLSAAEEELLKL